MTLLYATAQNGQLVFNNKDEAMKELLNLDTKQLVVKIDKKTHVRTDAQNRSLHLWLDMVARELNAGGYTVQLVLKEVIDLDWNKEICKELLWRPIQKALIKKNSTTDLDKVSEIDIVYDHINRYLGEKFGIHVPFPKDEDKDKPLNIEYPEEVYRPEF
jgi:hypothetical protein